MASASAPVQVAAPSRCDHIKEWCMINPVKRNFVIALIFTIGALVAHYACCGASWEWPVGIALAGFVAILVTRYIVGRSAGQKVYDAIAKRSVNEETLKYVTSESVHYRDDDGDSLLYYAIHIINTATADTEAATDPWVNLIKAIDERAPSLKDQQNENGRIPRQMALESLHPKIQTIFGVTNG